MTGISPQRRRTEAWRMWCEGNEVDEGDIIDKIAQRLRTAVRKWST
jgi:hypothetical protein